MENMVLKYADAFEISIDQEATYENIDSLMKKNQCSVQEMADRLHISVQAVYQWKKGLPNLDNLVAMSKIFDTKLDDLIVCRENSSM